MTSSCWTSLHYVELTNFLKLTLPWSLRDPASWCFLFLSDCIFSTIFFLSSSTSFLKSKFPPIFCTLFSCLPALYCFPGKRHLLSYYVEDAHPNLWTLPGFSKQNTCILLCAAVDSCSELHAARGDLCSLPFLSLAPSSVPPTYRVSCVYE